jgi:hypothetical protein
MDSFTQDALAKSGAVLNNGVWNYTNFDPNKFTKLIVNACCDRLNDPVFHDSKSVIRTAQALMRERFGLK